MAWRLKMMVLVITERCGAAEARVLETSCNQKNNLERLLKIIQIAEPTNFFFSLNVILL
jgi:hypothetical protein